MKILVLTNYDEGLYKFRKEVLEELCKKNKVIVSCPHGEYIDKIKKIGCKYIGQEFNRRGTNPIKDIEQFIGYVEIIKKVKPDVVLTYTIKPNVYGGLACQYTKTPYIANVTGLGTSIENGGIMQFLTTNLYKLGLRKANCVFFQNKNNRETFQKMNMVKGHTRLIPGSGVNLNFHSFEEYPSDENIIHFLFVGRIMKDKGINEIVEAIKTVHIEYPDISFDIVGGCDEDYEHYLEETEKTGFIHYRGRQDEMHDFYKNSHCVVLPSYHEGMANVLLEGASTGRPVIASDIPGCRETFIEGKTGFGCKPKSTESLVAAIRKFLALSNTEKQQMGIAGRNKVKSEFDRSIIIQAYLDEINKIGRN